MDKWLENIGDNPDLPEGELIKKLWNWRGCTTFNFRSYNY